MLVLSRRIGEAIVLPDDDVIIRVLAVHGGTVRLGITAPASVTVHREEVWRKNFLYACGDSSRRESPCPNKKFQNGLPPAELCADGGLDVPTLPR